MRTLPDFHNTDLTENQLITMMLTDGISALEIKDYVQTKYYKITQIRTSLPNLKEIPQNFRSFISSETEAKCLICYKTVNKNEMPFRTYDNKKLYILSYCQECQNVGDAEPLMKGSMAKKLSRREQSTRVNNKISENEIPLGYFSFLYNKQKGKCFYSGEPLSFNLREDLKNTFSVDRVIFDGGYRQGNIVFTLNKMNVMKSDMTVEEMKVWSPKLYERVNYFLENKSEFLMEGK